MAPALRALPGVQRVEVYGSGDEALWVQPDLAALRRYRVPVTAIVRALKEQVLLGPSGYLSQGHQDILVEARHLPTSVADLESIPVAAPAGPIPLRALARVVRAPLPTHNAVSLDGRPSIALTVFKQPGASTVPVTRAVDRTLAETLDQLPAGVRWVRTYNQGHLVHLIGADLGRNLLIGAALAIAGLFWILGAGRGIWALALAIPLSLLMGIAGLYALGQSLDLMTLGALTVAVGLLADDAVIVLESIYHRWEGGAGHWEGIRQGRRGHRQPRRHRHPDHRRGLRAASLRRRPGGSLLHPFCTLHGDRPARLASRFAEPHSAGARFHSGAAARQTNRRRARPRPPAASGTSACSTRCCAARG